MSDLKPLSDFFSAIADDPRINIVHIGVYAALLQQWQEHYFTNPVQIFSYNVIEIAKISASTYHKIIRQLSEYGYIKYEPSFKRNQGSKIYIIGLD